MNITPARWSAWQILRRVEEDGAYSSVLLAQQDDTLKPVDRALCHELVLGVLRWQLWLDKLIENYSGRASDSLDAVVRQALRLGLYQLRFLERVPQSAAVNESVKLVEAARKKHAKGFVNAILRRATREPEVDPSANINDPLEKLAVATSHPLWLIKNWVAQFGLNETATLARANNLAPPLVLRLGRAGRDALAELQADGATLTPGKLTPDAWLIDKMTPLARVMALEGWIYWQDEASQLAAHIVNAQPNEKILDLCAAPGSKTTHIASRQPLATVTACDIHANRLRVVVEAAERQGLTNVRAELLDATKPLPFAPASFDCVLVDAPCSGTGTLRRNPEIRWRITGADLTELSVRQLQILRQAARVVRPGGRLVYATCSVEKRENEAVAELFCQAQPEFTLTESRRIWPHREGADGFFLAVLTKQAA